MRDFLDEGLELFCTVIEEVCDLFGLSFDIIDQVFNSIMIMRRSIAVDDVMKLLFLFTVILIELILDWDGGLCWGTGFKDCG